MTLYGTLLSHRPAEFTILLLFSYSGPDRGHTDPRPADPSACHQGGERQDGMHVRPGVGQALLHQVVPERQRVLQIHSFRQTKNHNIQQAGHQRRCKCYY